MASGESRKTVFSALFANLVIAVSKFVVAAISGSAALLSEAIHSTVDTGNELVLLLGQKRAGKQANARHPFGYGLELYFWTLIVAILLFAVGGGMSAYEGITHVLHPPKELESAVWPYLVLGVALVSESISWSFAVRSLNRDRSGRSFWKTVKESKDPQVVAVFFEDSAAILGVLVAAVGVFLSHLFKMPVIDGVASIVIGVLLMGVAVLLARETRGLLVGEAADKRVVERIQQVVQEDPAVHKVGRPLTMHFGPEEVLLNLNVQFEEELSSGELTKTVERIERAIRELEPKIKRIYIEANALTKDPLPQG